MLDVFLDAARSHHVFLDNTKCCHVFLPRRCQVPAARLSTTASTKYFAPHPVVASSRSGATDRK